jgi:hypothetical protein
MERIRLLPFGRQLGYDWDYATIGVYARLESMRLGLDDSESQCRVDTKSKGIRPIIYDSERSLPARKVAN